MSERNFCSDSSWLGLEVDEVALTTGRVVLAMHDEPGVLGIIAVQAGIGVGPGDGVLTDGSFVEWPTLGRLVYLREPIGTPTADVPV
jgi:hypothetical protein